MFCCGVLQAICVKSQTLSSSSWCILAAFDQICDAMFWLWLCHVKFENAILKLISYQSASVKLLCSTYLKRALSNILSSLYLMTVITAPQICEHLNISCCNFAQCLLELLCNFKVKVDKIKYIKLEWKPILLQKLFYLKHALLSKLV